MDRLVELLIGEETKKHSIGVNERAEHCCRIHPHADFIPKKPSASLPCPSSIAMAKPAKVWSLWVAKAKASALHWNSFS